MYTQPARTTVQIDPEILYLVKTRALEQKKTLRELINEALLDLVKNTKLQTETSHVKIGGHNLGGIKGNLSREEIYEGF